MGDLQFSGRTALVTGSTSGIGEAVARAFAAQGAKVVVSGRDVERGNKVVNAIRAAGGVADFLAVDLAGSAESIRQFAAAAEKALGGRIDILVNNAAIYPAAPTHALRDEEVDAMLAVNIRAPHVLVAWLAPKMAERKSGTIVNIGSWMAKVGSPVAVLYAASKAALEQLTRGWAAEYGRGGVHVNTVAPGVTLTPGNEAYKAMLDAMTANTPAGSVVHPKNIADAVLFLSSPAATFLHGTSLNVDGGITATRLA